MKTKHESPKILLSEELRLENEATSVCQSDSNGSDRSLFLHMIFHLVSENCLQFVLGNACSKSSQQYIFTNVKITLKSCVLAV